MGSGISLLLPFGRVLHGSLSVAAAFFPLPFRGLETGAGSSRPGLSRRDGFLVMCCFFLFYHMGPDAPSFQLRHIHYCVSFFFSLENGVLEAVFNKEKSPLRAHTCMAGSSRFLRWFCLACRVRSLLLGRRMWMSLYMG